MIKHRFEATWLTWIQNFDYLSTVRESGWRVMTVPKWASVGKWMPKMSEYCQSECIWSSVDRATCTVPNITYELKPRFENKYNSLEILSTAAKYCFKYPMVLTKICEKYLAYLVGSSLKTFNELSNIMNKLLINDLLKRLSASTRRTQLVFSWSIPCIKPKWNKYCYIETLFLI